MSTALWRWLTCSAQGCHASANGPGEFEPEGWTNYGNGGQYCPEHSENNEDEEDEHLFA